MKNQDEKKQLKKRKEGNQKFVKRLLIIVLELFILFMAVGALVLLRGEQKSTEEAKTEMESVPVPEPVQEPAVTEQEETAETASEELPDPEKETVLTFAGDVSFAEGYANMGFLAQRENGIMDCFDEFIWKEMQEADLFMINNEFPYTSRGTPTEDKKFTFRAKPENVSILKEMGVDLVTLANNHVYDYGEVAVLDTLDTLDRAEILHAGAGRNREEAMKPATVTLNGMKISFICATQVEQLDNPDTKAATDQSAGVFRCFNDDSIYDVVRETKKDSDFVICYIHWGQELSEELNWAQTDQAEKLVEAGADLIVGAHPHILQGVDIIEGVPVIYSLGNFWFNSRTFDTALLKVTLKEGKISSVQMLPAIQSGCTTTMAGGEDRERILAYLQTHSPGAVFDPAGNITALN